MTDASFQDPFLPPFTGGVPGVALAKPGEGGMHGVCVLARTLSLRAAHKSSLSTSPVNGGGK